MDLCPNCFSSGSMYGYQCAICGFQNTVKRDARALPVGVTLHGRYIVGRVLGIGGFGITYNAYDMKRRCRFAIKEYFPAEWAMRQNNTNNIIPNSQAKDDLYRHGQEVFINEANVLAKLRNVPNIVDTVDFFVENQTAYMVMQFVDGYTLSGYMRSMGIKSIAYPLANKIICDIGMALNQVHSHSLLHRDIGPDNVMINAYQDVCLIDFGATRMYALNSPSSMSVLVKPGFAPIEQYSRSGKQGPWTDVYALAATYYYLVSGVKPPAAPDRIAGVALVPLNKLNPQISLQISEAVQKALSEDWKERPQNINDFLMAMGILPNSQRQEVQNWNTDQKIQKTKALWELTKTNKGERPSILMQIRNQRKRYWLIEDRYVNVGRVKEQSNIVIENKQVSALHCLIQYNSQTRLFMITNNSSNGTYIGQGMLAKGQSAYLRKGDWFYIQTSGERYIFYLEVE